MSKEYITDYLSIEDIAEMTDEMLRFEKSKKIGKNIKINFLRIIPAVAAIVFVIGVINILPVFKGIDVGAGSAAENAGEPETVIILYDTEDVEEIADLPKITNSDTPESGAWDDSGIVGFGYSITDEDEIPHIYSLLYEKNGDGTYMVSYDDGETWQKKDVSEMPASISAETEDKLLNYDEYVEYVETIAKSELQALLGTKYYENGEGPFEYTQEKINETIALYEKQLEQMKNGTTKVWLCYYKGTNEIAMICSSTETAQYITNQSNTEEYLIMNDDGAAVWMSENEYAITYPEPESIFWEYDEYKAWIENKKIEMQKLIGTSYFNGVESIEWTQQRIDQMMRFEEERLELVKSGFVKIPKSFMVYYSGEMAQTYSQGGVWIGIQITNSRYYLYRYTPEYGERWCFAALSYRELYKLVKEYFEEWIQAGKMTQEEADRLLAELPDEYWIEDDDGTIIEK